jgi:integrase/recombinase XerD
MKEKGLGDFLFVYRKFAVTENKSPRTIESVTDAVHHFDRYLKGCSDILQVQGKHLRTYIESLQQRDRWSNHPTIKTGQGKLSPHSIAAYVRSIKAFWSWLKREGFIEEDPLARIKVPKAPRKVINTLISDQVNKLLRVIPRKEHTGYRDHAIVITLYGTGLRSSELTTIRTGDVNFETGQIRIMGKGAKERYVYASANVYKVLFKYYHRWRPSVTSDYLFVHGNGLPLSRFYLAHRLQTYGKKAGIQGIRCSPHTFRHSFAVNYLRNGGDTFTLQRILGHSTLEMTRHYAEVADSDVEARLKVCSPAEQLDIQV